MKVSKKYIIGSSLILASLLVGGQIVAASNSQGTGFMGQEENAGQRQEFITALEARDYEQFISLIPEDAPFAGELTEENFAKLQEAHILMEQARTLMEEAGLPGGFMMKGQGFAKGHGNHNSAEHAEIEAALEAGDYEQFISLIPEDAPFAGELTEENFAKLQEAHQLRIAGDQEGAKAIMDELGFTPQAKRGMRGGR